MTQFKLKAPELSDLPTLVSYWHDYPKSYYQSLGINPDAIPSYDEDLKQMQLMFERSPKYVNNFYRIAMFDGDPMASVILKFEDDFSFGEMHFHIFKKEKRQKGAGKTIYTMALKHFFSFEGIEKIMMQPLVSNTAANKLLESLGIEVEKKYMQEPSEILLGGMVNKYVISKKEFLKWPDC